MPQESSPGGDADPFGDLLPSRKRSGSQKAGSDHESSVEVSNLDGKNGKGALDPSDFSVPYVRSMAKLTCSLPRICMKESGIGRLMDEILTHFPR